MIDVNNFGAMKIGLASPQQIKEWSYGEVKKPETINYRTLKPERDGLFCEKIFGPIKDWECHCGKYKRIRFKGVICDKCGVEVTRSKVRRERMGHIELASPVTHIWYFKGVPSRIGLLLDMSPRTLEKIIYFASYVVIDPGETPLQSRQLLSEMDYREAREKFKNGFKAGMGAEAIRELLLALELDELYDQLREDVKTVSGQKRTKAIKRLEVVEAFRKSGNRPEWMILDVVPVIPPELRPMVQLDGGRFATSDLNDLYRRVINRNNRLKRLLDLGAPEIIVKNEKRMLQEAVDALIDNGRRGRPVTGPNNRPLKSLSDMLKGKQGRFRQNLLGKRVDYSGRSVIVVGPNLKLHQCGLPKEMALELFKPFVMKKLVDHNLVHNIKSAKRMVERVRPEVWDVLEEVIKDHPVLLNRAPTLHRLGIQAFEPVLVEGKAIQIHPLVCTPYNADFDGDQMAVHLPLSAGAQAEARLLMLSANNILLPSFGKPAMVPSQDMVLGIYYLTIDKHDSKGQGKRFSDTDEAIMAWEAGECELQAPIRVRYTNHDGSVELINTTIGRIILNRAVPVELEQAFINETIDKRGMTRLISRVHAEFGNARTSVLLDNLKQLGFRFATRSGNTIGVDDIQVPPEKPSILKKSDDRVALLDVWFRKGWITDGERYRHIKEIWSKATNDVEAAMMRHLDRLNPVYMMATSGARGNPAQVKQIAGMRGLMADPSGRIIPLPIRANLREGLSVLEYFISTHGARKGLADTALRTADSGYLTRRLIDVSQDVIIRESDCQTTRSIRMEAIEDGGDVMVSLQERISGRTAAEDIVIDEDTGEVLASAHEEIPDLVGEKVEKAGGVVVDVSEARSRISSFNILHPKTGATIVREGERFTEETAKEVAAAGISMVRVKTVKIRSVLTCGARFGLCIKCYGRNLATGKQVDIGETVGIIAAQSIGEPGTQLTLRTFHTGGVASEDIITGLPRVEELFEARKPKGFAVMSEHEGIVFISEEKRQRKITIKSTGGMETSHLVPFSARLIVREGDHIEAGEQLVDGPLNPHDVLRVRGVEEVQKYLVNEVQHVYRSQGVDINDKHVEVIVRQMLRKVKVEDAGDTVILPGALVDRPIVEEENRKLRDRKRQTGEDVHMATTKDVLMGVTKASLATDSFLSAASFQETTRVLTEAAINGKIDPLLGLKENVIIGKLIPAGTGMPRYRNIEMQTDEVEPLPYYEGGGDDGVWRDEEAEAAYEGDYADSYQDIEA
jgi:DNA-directed RNA polymerase subunit beta'